MARIMITFSINPAVKSKFGLQQGLNIACVNGYSLYNARLDKDMFVF